MGSPALYSALGVTIVFIGSVIQFIRDARNLGGAVGSFNTAHEELAMETIKERRARLPWYQWRRWLATPMQVRREVKDSLPPDEVIIVNDIDRFSRGWAFVAVGSLCSAIASWWQVSTG